MSQMSQEPGARRRSQEDSKMEINRGTTGFYDRNKQSCISTQENDLSLGPTRNELIRGNPE
jgi:hypothetical protein